jgi:hypothetical protein
MKKLFWFILIGVLSCENRKQLPAEIASDTGENTMWSTYEGRVPLNDDYSLYIEVSIKPSTETGRGIFELKESVEGGNSVSTAVTFKGEYSTLYGENAEERIVQFHNTAREQGLKRTHVVTGFKNNVTDSRLKMIREEEFRATDLTLKVGDKHKLLVLDDRLQQVSTESEHNLVKRTSRVFTIEGYFRHNGDSADFVELNTGENWPVSKYGDYMKAIRQYHQLTQKKFQVTYLKGTGFSIRHTNKQGEELDALVIRKVLQMTSTSDLE